MNRRERLMATLRGEAVDRPALNFYEIGGFKVDPSDSDPFNVYNSPDWQPLLQMAEEKTDLIRMRSPVRQRSHTAWDDSGGEAHSEFFSSETFMDKDQLMKRTTLTVGGRTMTSLTRRAPHVDTIWTVDHLLKNIDDLKAYLEVPDEAFLENVDVTPLVEEEKALGDDGIVMVDTEDPLCAAASLFDLAEFTITAMTEQEWFHKLVEKCSRYIYPRVEKIAREFPGRLWRIYGAEYAVEPFLPSSLFQEYEVQYTAPMVKMIQEHGGFVRLHAHGRISSALKHMSSMGVDAIDPIEPPPQGDVDLGWVREAYGKDMVLFGNIEISDIENLAPDRFAEVAKKTLEDGTKGEGRGFVLMPTASPYGREITAQTMKNYETLVELVEQG